MILARHGGSSHYVRPDFTYRTSVLQSIVGYSPQQDVMNVARDFTQGPYRFMQGNVNIAPPIQSPTPSAVVSTVVSQPGVNGLGNVQLLGFNAAPIQFLGAMSNMTGRLSMWWMNLKAKIAAWKMAHMHAKVAGMSGLMGIIPYGPKLWAGPQVVNSPSQKMAMLVAMQQSHQPSVFGPQNTDVIMNRWNNLRLPSW